MIVVDVETTGLNPAKNSLLSIGALDFNSPENQFYGECRIKEGAEVTRKALEINGFTKEQITDTSKPYPDELILQFYNWMNKIEDRTLAGQNPWFDRNFLEPSEKNYNFEWALGRRIIDLHTLCYTSHLTHGKHPPLKKGKSDLDMNTESNYVGLPSEPEPHNALNGAKLEAEALSRLIYGKNLFKEFSQHPIQQELIK